MRRLGLIGGMSWESTTEYYRLINRGIATRLGGLHSADLLLHSVDFAPVAALQQSGDWEGAGALLAEAARGLERAGAHAIVLCTNTMHHVSGHIETAVAIPLLHIVDTTGQALAEAGIRRAGLLGTRYTMELPFWRQRLRDRFGVDLVVPDEADRTVVHDVIYKELCLGRIEPRSRAAYAHIIDRLAGAGLKPSCSAAPRSRCSCGGRTRCCPSSTPRRSTPTPPWNLRWQINVAPRKRQKRCPRARTDHKWRGELPFVRPERRSTK
jgi:amino-acid racemase